jgi:uroporphyrinogen III methyltransferase/synthase
MAQTGSVYLVGAGPGAIAFLTVQGQRLLQQAEVVVYDALVNPEMLALTPATCLQIGVGKRGGQASTPQAEINQLLVHYCQQGKQVVRLKGGDPFIFGRCASEIAALRRAKCSVIVVPGLSSALAAPLLAGIPITDPHWSNTFAVTSAHDPSQLPWSALAAIDTLVILMGGQHLAILCQQLQAQGRSPTTPIAIIRAAGQSQQQIWTGTLATIVTQTVGVTLSPCVIVIGEVVRLREELGFLNLDNRQTPFGKNCTMTLSLSGKTILVTRAAGQAHEFSDRLRQEGAMVIEMPTLEIGPPSSWTALDTAIQHLHQFDWLILTSTNGVDAFFERLTLQRKDGRSLAGLKIAVVGQKTAHCLQQHGLSPDFVPPNFVADALVDHFPGNLAGQRLLFPRVESGGRDVLVKGLTERGATVTEVPAYESYCPGAIAPSALTALQHGTVDVITFASSKTVRNFCQLAQSALGSVWLTQLSSICLASIGPQTSATCQDCLGRVDIEAQEYTLSGLVEALKSWAIQCDRLASQEKSLLL